MAAILPWFQRAFGTGATGGHLRSTADRPGSNPL